MLIPEKAVLDVCRSYFQYNDINSVTFVTHSEHLFLVEKKLNWTAFPVEYQDLTWKIFSSYNNSYHMCVLRKIKY